MKLPSGSRDASAAEGSPPGLKLGLAWFRDYPDWLPPFVVRELRRSWRQRFVPWMMLFHVVALLGLLALTWLRGLGTEGATWVISAICMLMVAGRKNESADEELLRPGFELVRLTLRNGWSYYAQRWLAQMLPVGIMALAFVLILAMRSRVAPEPLAGGLLMLAFLCLAMSLAGLFPILGGNRAGNRFSGVAGVVALLVLMRVVGIMAFSGVDASFSASVLERFPGGLWDRSLLLLCAGAQAALLAAHLIKIASVRINPDGLNLETPYRWLLLLLGSAAVILCLSVAVNWMLVLLHCVMGSICALISPPRLQRRCVDTVRGSWGPFSPTRESAPGFVLLVGFAWALPLYGRSGGGALAALMLAALGWTVWVARILSLFRKGRAIPAGWLFLGLFLIAALVSLIWSLAPETRVYFKWIPPGVNELGEIGESGPAWLSLAWLVAGVMAFWLLPSPTPRADTETAPVVPRVSAPAETVTMPGSGGVFHAAKVRDFPDGLGADLVRLLRQGLRAPAFAALFLIALVLQCLLVLLGIGGTVGGVWTSAFLVGVSVLAMTANTASGSLAHDFAEERRGSCRVAGLSAWGLVGGHWGASIARMLLLLLALLPFRFMAGIAGTSDLVWELQFLGGLLVVGCLVAAFVLASRRWLGWFVGIVVVSGVLQSPIGRTAWLPTISLPALIIGVFGLTFFLLSLAAERLNLEHRNLCLPGRLGMALLLWGGLLLSPWMTGLHWVVAVLFALQSARVLSEASIIIPESFSTVARYRWLWPLRWLLIPGWPSGLLYVLATALVGVSLWTATGRAGSDGLRLLLAFLAWWFCPLVLVGLFRRIVGYESWLGWYFFSLALMGAFFAVTGGLLLDATPKALAAAQIMAPLLPGSNLAFALIQPSLLSTLFCGIHLLLALALGFRGAWPFFREMREAEGVACAKELS